MSKEKEVEPGKGGEDWEKGADPRGVNDAEKRRNPQYSKRESRGGKCAMARVLQEHLVGKRKRTRLLSVLKRAIARQEGGREGKEN